MRVSERASDDDTGSGPRSGPTRRTGVSVASINVLVAIALVAIVLGPWIGGFFPGPEAPPASVPARAVEPVGEAHPARRASEPPRTDPEPMPTGGEAAAAEQEALSLYRAGRVAEACERYRDVSRQAPSAAARRNLGACLARLGREAYQTDRTALAIEHYQRAVDAYPDGAEHWGGLAIAHVRAGELTRAEDVLREAVRRFPEHGEIAYLLAEVLERQGRTREAVAALRRLVSAHPNHARGRTLLATLEREQKVEGGYWSHESVHFLVRYEGAGGIDLGRSVVDILEEAYASIGRDLGVYPQDRIQVGIYTTEVLGQVIGIPAHFVRGAFDGRKLRLNLAESVAYSNDLARLVRHEYAHAVIHLATNGRAPIWVHEGLAQMLEPRSAPRFLEVSVPRQYLTLAGIERLSRTMDPAAFTAGYQLTHVAVGHLIDRGGLSAVRAFLARLGQGESVPQALQGAFGFGVEELEARLLAAGGKG